ncbi:protoporphyrinogen oxidase HemJ [Bauldia sp.]|uniref:protoporphyrinogen oxidase HemJ n=1 Tax=Bauldia sp. TaxID=2575872 RepID=UPI003BA84C85
METDTATRVRRAVIGLVAVVVLVGILVLWQPSNLYLWIKAAHVIAVIAWMAGMLYLPRLFVYHVSAEPGSVQSETFKVMERRLLTVIINPAMVVTWALGLWLAWDGAWFSSIWLHIKIALVIVLSGVHGLFSRWTREFADDRNERSEKFYRAVNEIPTVLMIAIVILVIVKPF